MTLCLTVYMPLCLVSRFMYCHDECRYDKYRYAECHYAECRYAQCRYVECRGAGKNHFVATGS